MCDEHGVIGHFPQGYCGRKRKAGVAVCNISRCFFLLSLINFVGTKHLALNTITGVNNNGIWVGIHVCMLGIFQPRPLEDHNWYYNIFRPCLCKKKHKKHSNKLRTYVGVKYVILPK